jgi:hypothetical protein
LLPVGWGSAWVPCWVLREQAPRVGVGCFGRWPAVGHDTVFSPLVLGASPVGEGRGVGGGGGSWRVVVGCVFVENCTVDASIFVVKLLRAHGGCLGTRSR